MRRLESEFVDLRSALGRITAEDVPARRDHPSTAVCAMDSYALRSADIVQLPVRLPARGALIPHRAALTKWCLKPSGRDWRNAD
jgi:molybdopterin biosynthesis enzyme